MVDHSKKKRPRDPNQLCKTIVDISVGEVEDRAPTPEEQGKDPAAVFSGSLWKWLSWVRVSRHRMC
jgi:hypothetical protein